MTPLYTVVPCRWISLLISRRVDLTALRSCTRLSTLLYMVFSSPLRGRIIALLYWWSLLDDLRVLHMSWTLLILSWLGVNIRPSRFLIEVLAPRRLNLIYCNSSACSTPRAIDALLRDLLLRIPPTLSTVQLNSRRIQGLERLWWGYVNLLLMLLQLLLLLVVESKSMSVDCCATTTYGRSSLNAAKYCSLRAIEVRVKHLLILSISRCRSKNQVVEEILSLAQPVRAASFRTTILRRWIHIIIVRDKCLVHL